MFGTPFPPFADSTALTISSPSRESIASGFSQRIIFPAFAAAIAISLCVLFGVQMSIASMSFRSTSFFQSVSTDSYPHCLANASTFSLSRAHTALSTGRYAKSKKLLTFRYALECARPMNPYPITPTLRFFMIARVSRDGVSQQFAAPEQLAFPLRHAVLHVLHEILALQVDGEGDEVVRDGEDALPAPFVQLRRDRVEQPLRDVERRLHKDQLEDLVAFLFEAGRDQVDLARLVSLKIARVPDHRLGALGVLGQPLSPLGVQADADQRRQFFVLGVVYDRDAVRRPLDLRLADGLGNGVDELLPHRIFDRLERRD